MAVEQNAEFPKYLKLVDELREHVLSFAEPKTLWNYSQCSIDCNKDIQKFNTKAPSAVWINEASNRVSLTLSYSKTNYAFDFENGYSWNDSKTTHHFTDQATYDEAMETIENQITQAFKYVKKRTTQRLTIAADKWPVMLMRSELFPVLETLVVLIRNTTLNEFVEFAQTTEIRVKKLQMLEFRRQSIDKEKLKQVFHTEFFQQVEKVNIDVSCDFEDDDFLAFKNPRITLIVKNRRISDDAIREKVAEINDSPLEHKIKYQIPLDDPHKFNLQVMFPMTTNIRYIKGSYYQVGNVYVKTNIGYKITISNRDL